ncbi:MAG: AAA family ATPase [bacterium]
MGRILCIANQKGGVGKTTTALNLAACLSDVGRRVLLIDVDPQANASSGLQACFSEDPERATIYEALMGECTVEDARVEVMPGHLWLVPSDTDLAGAEIELLDRERREYRLRDAMACAADNYDYVIIDCPPSLSILTLNALVACERVLIPLQCEYYALEGLGRLMRTLGLVRERLNPSLTIGGILLTMYDARNNLSRQVREETIKHFGDKVYRTKVPRNVRLGEAPSYGLPIIQYDINCAGGRAYIALADEILIRDGLASGESRESQGGE